MHALHIYKSNLYPVLISLLSWPVIAPCGPVSRPSLGLLGGFHSAAGKKLLLDNLLNSD